MRDNAAELFAILSDDGQVIGRATRGECHSGSRLLHGVVHLHVMNSAGELYLQRRPEWKDIQPGRWDTSVGGHIDYGECREVALRREAQEELGLDIEGLRVDFLGSYIFESSVEREYVSSYLVCYDGLLRPSLELDGGSFWSYESIDGSLEGAVLTENFVYEWRRYLRAVLSR